MLANVEENLAPDSRIHKRLGQLIEALVEDEVGSSRELGRLTGIAFNTLVNWSEGKADPRLQKLVQFAYAIGWSMTELMYYAEGDEDPKEAIARKKKPPAATIESESFLKENNSFVGISKTLTPEQIQRRQLFLQRTKVDLLPDITSRKRLYVLLVDSMAVKGISELDLFEKTHIASEMLAKIRNMDMKFNFNYACLEKLAPHLLQVECWEELRPVFKLPYISYQNCIDNLVEDLHSNPNSSLLEVA